MGSNTKGIVQGTHKAGCGDEAQEQRRPEAQVVGLPHQVPLCLHAWG